MADEIVDSICVLLPDLAVFSAGGSEAENIRGGKMTKDVNSQFNWKIHGEAVNRVSPNKCNLLKGLMSEYGGKSPCQPCLRSKIIADDQQAVWSTMFINHHGQRKRMKLAIEAFHGFITL